MSQLPVLLGGLKPQIFLSSIIKSVISKLDDDTFEGVAGYSSPHLVAFKTFFPFRLFNVDSSGVPDKIAGKLPGG